MTTDIANLLDERDIERALITFARAMDDRDWDGMSQILDENAAGEFGNGRLEGRSAIIEMIQGFLNNCGATQHLLANTLIDVDGNRATSRCYVQDLHLSRSDPDRVGWRELTDQVSRAWGYGRRRTSRPRTSR